MYTYIFQPKLCVFKMNDMLWSATLEKTRTLKLSVSYQSCFPSIQEIDTPQKNNSIVKLWQGLTNLIKSMYNQTEPNIHQYIVGTISYLCANCGLCTSLKVDYKDSHCWSWWCQESYKLNWGCLVQKKKKKMVLHKALYRECKLYLHNKCGP